LYARSSKVTEWTNLTDNVGTSGKSAGLQRKSLSMDKPMPNSKRRRNKRGAQKPRGRWSLKRNKKGGIPTDNFEWAPTHRPAWKLRNERRAEGKVGRKNAARTLRRRHTARKRAEAMENEA
jgi:hypothetical protein